MPKFLRNHGLSTELIGLVATSLSDRVMSIQVGSCWSGKRAVSGDVLYGSILGQQLNKAPVFHPMLTDEQDEQLERLQAIALRYILGYSLTYAKIREMSGLDTLRQRRIVLCNKFTGKCLGNPRFASRFPSNRPSRASRHTLKYEEYFPRCDRLRNSLCFTCAAA